MEQAKPGNGAGDNARGGDGTSVPSTYWVGCGV